MGCGKSTVGRALAQASGRSHIDTDRELERRLGSSINKLFTVYGEQAFRDHETALLRSLEPTPIVISTGGGTVLRDQNWIEIGRLGTSIYLQATLEVLFARLERGKWRRPLLSSDDWKSRVEQILLAREHLYQRADLTVSLDMRTTEEIVESILGRLGE